MHGLTLSRCYSCQVTLQCIKDSKRMERIISSEKVFDGCGFLPLSSTRLQHCVAFIVMRLKCANQVFLEHTIFNFLYPQAVLSSQKTPEIDLNNHIFPPPPGDSPYKICSYIRGCTEMSMLHHNENIRSKEGTLSNLSL